MALEVKLKNLVLESDVDLIIINHQLSASQTRNLEKYLDKRVIDKTELILDIFATRATSHIGKLQVELAQLNHLSTRLIRGWTHLERQKGGIGLRGPGETQLETDRRLIGKRIKRLNLRLEKSHKQREINRYSRKKSRNKLVALVGYTNVGKSTLINTLLNRQQTVTYDEPGVTRDILEFPLIHDDKHVMLLDTGGLLEGQGKDMDFQSDIEERVKASLTDVQKIIFMVDYKTGIHPLDHSIAKWLYKNGLATSGKNCLLAINKVDDPSSESYTTEFRKLGFKENRSISSLNKRGIKDLFKWIFDDINPHPIAVSYTHLTLPTTPYV